MGGSAEVCLQWNHFRNNVNTVFGTFRGNANLADVTLVCEDGEKVEAHKIALAASSHFLSNLLKINKDLSHPVLNLPWIKLEQVESMLDFIFHVRQGFSRMTSIFSHIGCGVWN